MHLGRARLTQHAHYLPGCRAAHHRVIHDEHALSRHDVRERRQLEPHAHLAQLLRGRDERTGHVAVLDEPRRKRQAQLHGKALRSRRTAIWHACHQVNVCRCLPGKLPSHFVANHVERATVLHGIGTREVDLLEDALGLTHLRQALLAHEPPVRDAQDLAGTHLSHEGRPNDIETTGLARHDPFVLIKPPEDKRSYAQRIAKGVEGVLPYQHHGIPALDHLHGSSNALAQVRGPVREVADEASCHLAVRIRAKGNARLYQLVAQLVEVDERPVMGKGDGHVTDRREVRLGRFPALRACGAVAAVAYGDPALHGLQVLVLEDLRNQAKVLTNEHGLSVADGDARRVLAAMLKRPQGKVSHAGHVTARSPDAKDATLLTKLGGVDIHLPPLAMSPPRRDAVSGRVILTRC